MNARPSHDEIFAHYTDILVTEIYAEFERQRERVMLLDLLCDQLDPGEVDRAIDLILQTA